MNTITNNTQGITLVEILISISVLSIGILGVLQAFPQGTSAERSLEMRAIANHLAQEKLESYEAISYDEIPVGTPENGVPVGADVTSPFYPFERTVDIAHMDQNLAVSGSDIGLKRITVTIAWDNPIDTGARDSIALVTLRSK